MLIRIKEPDYVLFVHLYLPVEEFNEMNEFYDIKDAFIPISNIVPDAIPGIGIKLFLLDAKGKIIKNTLVFIESEQFLA